MNILALQRVGV